MINRILQSDIDLAHRLIEARHTDEEIIGTLVRRKIERQKAEQLLAALRSGAHVDPEVEINYEVGKVPAEIPQAEPAEDSRQYQRAHRSSSHGVGGKKWALWLLIVLVVAGAIAFLLFSGGEIQPEENPPGEAAPAIEIADPGQAPPAPTKAPKPATAPSTNQ